MVIITLASILSIFFSIAGVDYTPLDVTLTFSETVTVIIVNITLLDDIALEGDEDFKAQLSTSSGSNVGLPQPDATITIVDRDSKPPLVLIRSNCQPCDYSCWLLIIPIIQVNSEPCNIIDIQENI